jgi:hypothetical protein
LFGKDLISTAEGDPVITATPQILGQMIPYVGDNGIGLHPESWAEDAYRFYYFCPDSATPIRLSRDGTTEINYGMVDFFRDLTIESYGSKKIGGFDPHKNLYVLHSELPLTPTYQVGCGNILYKTLSEPFTYTFNLNDLLGDITLNYVVNDLVNIDITYNEETTSFPNQTGTGSVSIQRDNLTVTTAQITITPVNETAYVEITSLCPVGVPLKITSIVLADDNDLNTTIVNRQSWGNSNLYSQNIIFENSEINSFDTEQGLEGVGKFPTSGSQVTLQAYKGNLNNGEFSIDLGNNIQYLISDQVYTQADIETILTNATELSLSLTQLSASSYVVSGSFNFVRPTLNHNLYLIWDYRGVNQPPIALRDVISVNKGGSVTSDLTANDIDPESDSLTVIINSQPSHGNLVNNGDGTVTYTHDDSDNLSDSFTYYINDGFSNSNIATVSIGVGIGVGDSITTSGGTGVFLIPFVVGTVETDIVVHFNSISVPDRFEILFDPNNNPTDYNDAATMPVVADSLFIGDQTVSDQNIPANGTTPGLDLNVYKWFYI